MTLRHSRDAGEDRGEGFELSAAVERFERLELTFQVFNLADIIQI
jgi:hypothetical protein